MSTPAAPAVPVRRSPTRFARILVLRAVPLMFSTVLATSTLGGIITDLELPYRVSASLASFAYLALALAPKLIRLRLVAVTLSGLAWLGRMFWFVVEDVQAFTWSSTYAAVVLGTLVCCSVMWSFTADWLVLRGLSE